MVVTPRLLRLVVTPRSPSGGTVGQVTEPQGKPTVTYPDHLVGASLAAASTADPMRASLPVGYHHVRRRWLLGVDDEAFAAAVECLMSWQMHRRAGLRIDDSTPRAAEGVAVAMSSGVGPLRLQVPCLVVATVDEFDRQGFAYGTLPGHPESGEEAFVVQRVGSGIDEACEVWVSIVAFSRPASRLARLAGPVGTFAQERMTDRYLRALQKSVLLGA
jgi:uncharacterized protein (UPF0548 family)